MVTNGRVAVVGGSLGGLTAALLLRDLGLDVQGRVVHQQDQPYRFSNWNTVHRSLLRCFGRDRYLLGHEGVDVRQADGRVRVTRAGRSEVEVDLVVCADGAGSRCRARLLPDVRPRYAGYWRGAAWCRSGSWASGPRPSPTPSRTTCSRNSHVLVYPIPGMDRSVRPGDRLVNFVWYRNYLAGGELTDLMTDCEGAVRELSLPPGAVRPGRICLVGDAAFAVRPHAAAGTAKAAADAWELARALAEQPDIESALRAWEPGQLRLGRSLLERTRRIGRRSQVDGTWTPGDPELIYGLHGPGR